MQTSDINERVQAAFQVEHKEYLETIRTLLSDVSACDAGGAEARVDEVFRLAHSLKGGARICDLRPIENLGHRLETLFSRVRGGKLRLNSDVVQGVNTVLNSIEDWMAALAQNESPREPDNAIQIIDRILDPQPAAAVQEKEPADLNGQLLEAFCLEYMEYVSGLRAILSHVPAGGAIRSDELDEALRMARSLREAAHLAVVPDVEQWGARVEDLMLQVQAKTRTCTDDLCQEINARVDDVERAMANLIAGRSNPAAPPAPTALPPLPFEVASGESVESNESTTPESPRNQALFPPVDMVRVSSINLDRLLRSTSQLHVESLRQDQVAKELHLLDHQIDDIQRERNTLRKTSTAALHRLAGLPEFNRVLRYLNSLDGHVRGLASRARQVRMLQRRSSWLLNSLGQQVQQDVRQARMAPAESVFQGFRKMIRDLARDQGKQVNITISGFDVMVDRKVLQTLKDPLMHVLRNAITHGIELPEVRRAGGKVPIGQIDIVLEVVGNRLCITVDDDGRGINAAHVKETAVRLSLLSEAAAAQQSAEQLARLIFQPGFTTSHIVTEDSGRGMGLSVVDEAVKRLQGSVELSAKSRPGTTLRMSVPLSISTHRLLLVIAANQIFALPIPAVELLLRIKNAELETVEGKPIVRVQQELVPLVSLAHLLGLEQPDQPSSDGRAQIAILRVGEKRLAVRVEAFVAERDSFICPLDAPSASTSFLGGVLLEDGRVALVLNPAETIEQFKITRRAALQLAPVASSQVAQRPTVLVVDDSFTTRTLERNLLEAYGYDVRIAVDGAEAMLQLRTENHGVNLVISDIQMPHLDGFGLLANIKQDPRLATLPVILVTSMDSREDKERGLSLGADAYIVKRKFDHETLLETIRQLI